MPGSVQHTSATRAEAIRLRDAGFTVRQVAEILARRGTKVTPSTIAYWSSPTALAQRRRYDREQKAIKNARRAEFRWPGRPRTEAWLLGRMRVLDQAGLSAAAVAKVMSVDHDVALTEDQVRYALQTGSDAALRRAAA